MINDTIFYSYDNNYPSLKTSSMIQTQYNLKFNKLQIACKVVNAVLHQ